MKTLTTEDIQKFRSKIRALSNSGQYKKAFLLSAKLHKQFPKVLEFAYLKAVFFAEDPRGLNPKQLRARYKKTANNLKPLLSRLKGVDLNLAHSIRNEYYWFSGQPMKQYQLGVEGVRLGEKKSYYSQGVGAVEVAKQYGLKGKRKLCIKWAKISERAWLNYFKVVPRWYNSYLFCGKALGFQGKANEMKKALQKGSRISGMSINDEMFVGVIHEVEEVLAKLKKVRSRNA